jgi:hypothetical protein
MVNIQIYLHAKFHIFEALKYFSYFYSHADLFNWKKDLNWQNYHGPLSLRPAQLGADFSPSPRVSRPASQPVTVPSSLPNSRRRAGHPSPPRATRRHTCAPAALSRRVDCGAPWHPITGAPLLCCCPSLLQPGRRARSSATKPHAACPAGRADTTKSTPSRPRRSPADAHT